MRADYFSFNEGHTGIATVEKGPVTSRKRALRDHTPQAESSAGPSKRLRVKKCTSMPSPQSMTCPFTRTFIAVTRSKGTVVPSSSSNSKVTAAPSISKPSHYISPLLN